MERLAREGRLAETRTSFRTRLAARLLPEIAFADVRESRLVLGMALADPEAVAAAAASRPGHKQLDLFEAAAASASGADPRVAAEDPLLAAVRARGGATWARMVAALDGAIGLLRARGATLADLERIASRGRGVAAVRARTIATAMAALDARLLQFGARDGRAMGALLANAIAAADTVELVTVIGALGIEAKWLLAWEPSDLAWFRAIDEKLSPHGGFARVTLPAFDHPLEGTRERDPLEVLTEEVARILDAPPDDEIIVPVLGDLTFSPSSTPPTGLERLQLVRASDAGLQARAAVVAVEEALAAGALVERVVVALPVLDERTLAPLRRAFEDAGLVSYESRGAPLGSAPVIATAMLALELSASLERHAVARLLRSGYVDAPRLVPEGTDGRDATRSLVRVAQALESSATASGDDPESRLVRTAAAPASTSFRRNEEHQEADAALAGKVANVLAAPAKARTRIEHIRAARALWSALGLGARAGRGGLSAFARDEAPEGVARAERLAIARDARAWDGLVSVLDLYEMTTHRAHALDQELDAELFRLELAELLDGSGSRPGAGRAGAIRFSRLADVPGDPLDLLVVLDANEGLLPRDDGHDALAGPTLLDALARGVDRSKTTFIAPAPGIRRAQELAALAMAAAEAERIVIVSVREDASGAPLGPSPVVTALERQGAVASSVQNEAKALGASDDVLLRVRREREREGFFLDPSRPRSDVVGQIRTSDEARAILRNATGGGERPLAVTSLERFAKCPFMGFAQAVLAAREPMPHDELPDAREEGTLVHDALAEAFTATREAWPKSPRDAEAIMRDGLAAADVVLERWQGHAPLRAIVRLKVRDSVRAVLAAAILDEAWDFALAEKAFGARSRDAWPALHIDYEGERLTLRGTIDRIDQSRGGKKALRVVDYKRSKSTVRDAGSSLGETALQVPLYACLSAQELGVPATGTYLPFQARDVAEAKTPPAVEQKMVDLVTRVGGASISPVEHRAISLVIAARSGTLAPFPADDSECRNCAVSGGCRKPRFAMAPAEDLEEP
ncbi:ATP-dependent nuclease, subunit B [Labilithrix luteola]|uniref:ATP-dependent nuclease, subunit B n=1 Tax=Labilithrix luteola TaxID=1391654 RepID=A0A0K1QGD7_9BACT|nr:ATP-dependent nuclease, subunit B [Labilithrix luteola]